MFAHVCPCFSRLNGAIEKYPAKDINIERPLKLKSHRKERDFRREQSLERRSWKLSNRFEIHIDFRVQRISNRKETRLHLKLRMIVKLTERKQDSI